jgi:hypothetical protein
MHRDVNTARATERQLTCSGCDCTVACTAEDCIEDWSVDDDFIVFIAVFVVVFVVAVFVELLAAERAIIERERVKQKV